MTARLEFEKRIRLADQDGSLFFSGGHCDDYLELSLPCAAAPVDMARALSRIPVEAKGRTFGFHLYEVDPIVLGVELLYVGDSEQRKLRSAERLRFALTELAEAIPEFDFGELLPDRPSRVETSAAPLEAQRAVLPAPDQPPAAGAAPAALPQPAGAETSPVVLDEASGGIDQAATPSRLPRQAPELTPAVRRVAERYLTAEMGLAAARNQARRGQTKKVLDTLEAVLRHEPGNAEAWQMCSELRQLEQREKKRRREPRNGKAHLEVGFSYLLFERDDEAMEALTQATRLSPQDWLAHVLLGIALHRQGQAAPARRAYERATRLRPEDRVNRDLLAALQRGEPPPPLTEDGPRRGLALSGFAQSSLLRAG